MERLEEVGGIMTFHEYLIITAVIFIIVDIFFASDIPTHIAYIIFSYVIADKVDVHFMYRILIGICSWFVLVLFHYFLWQKFLSIINDKLIAPEKIAPGIRSLINQEGIIKEIENKLFVVINDELYPFSCEEKLIKNDRILVLEVLDGTLIIKKLKES